MKKLIFNGEEYEAERIVKTNTDIIGYNGNQEVFAFRGISDFSQFTLVECEFDIDEKTKMQNEIDFLTLKILDLMGV